MTPTPRTDAQLERSGGLLDMADFARELERENAELRKALEPFAKFGKKLIGRRQVPASGVWQGLDSGCDGEVSIDIEHFQAARSALGEGGSAPEPLPGHKNASTGRTGAREGR